jgi:hypothetical protein
MEASRVALQAAGDGTVTPGVRRGGDLRPAGDDAHQLRDDRTMVVPDRAMAYEEDDDGGAISLLQFQAGRRPRVRSAPFAR